MDYPAVAVIVIVLASTTEDPLPGLRFFPTPTPTPMPTLDPMMRDVMTAVMKIIARGDRWRLAVDWGVDPFLFGITTASGGDLL